MTRPLAGLAVTPLGFPDSYAPVVGYADGWPVAYDPKAGRAWLTHCYASVGVGRDLAPDTGTGGELYAVIGHGPRQLDRNIAIVGRVIEGIDTLGLAPRGTGALGFYKDKAQNVPIASDPPGGRHAGGGAAVLSNIWTPDSPAFARTCTSAPTARTISIMRPAGGVDLCNAPVPVRKKPESAQAAQAARRDFVLDDGRAVCERMLASASGNAVVQKAHSG